MIDPDVMFLSRNRDVLEKYFLFFLPSHKLLKSLTSKLDLIEIAEKNKIPLPLSIRRKNQSDLKKIPSIFFPCVLKPEAPVFMADRKGIQNWNRRIKSHSRCE